MAKFQRPQFIQVVEDCRKAWGIGAAVSSSQPPDFRVVKWLARVTTKDLDRRSSNVVARRYSWA
jgi:hypothetical protein